MTFRLLASLFHKYRAQSSSVVLHSADGGDSGGGGDTGYLAQHPLLEQIPELRADVEQPEYCALCDGDLRSVNAWFGPAGTVRVMRALQ